eukprot:scaffold2801_cov161-Ochromonas_danica.AAC.16
MKQSTNLTPFLSLDPRPENDVNGVETTTPDGDMLRKLSLRSMNVNRMGNLATCTPSKILFSPGLRIKASTLQLTPESDGESETSEGNQNQAYATECSFTTDTTGSPQVCDRSSQPSEEIKQHITEDSQISIDAPETPERQPVSPACADHAEVNDIYDISLDADDQSSTIEVEEEPDDDDMSFNPYLFIAQLPDPSQVARDHNAHLPAFDGSLPTLVLDLDETLVHCTVEAVEKADVVFPVEFNGTTYKVYGRKRPYLDYFLEQVAKSFEVVVFTASQRVYADVLMDLLDPQKRLIKHRLFRESCLLVQGSYLKDLQVLGRDLQRTLLVDNSPYAYGYQIDNGVPIESWYDDDKDTELLKLLGFLRRAQTVSDVRPLIRSHFKTHELIEEAVKKLKQKESRRQNHLDATR